MKRLVGLLLATSLVTGCSWLGIGGSDSDDSEIKQAELVDFDSEVKVDKLWSNGGVGESDWIGRNLKPALSNGLIYAADSEGNIIAVSRSDGDTVWKKNLETTLSGGVGVGTDSIYVGSTEGEVFSLDAQTGDLQWQATTSSEVLSAPASDGRIVVVQSQDARLVGLNAETGEEQWRFQLSVPLLTLRGSSSPLIVGPIVVASFANGKIYGLALDTGTQLWENRIAVPQGRTELERIVDVDGQPLLVGDVIYAGSYQGRLSATNRGTGRTLWSQDSSSFHGPAHGLSQIYLSEADDTIRAFRASSGQVLWSNDQMTLRKLSAPVTAGGYVAVADGEGYLHLLSQVDGHFVGRTKVDGSGVSAPMLGDDDKLYVLDNDGGITAYGFIEK